MATLGSFTTSGSFSFEDDVLPTIAGPLSIGGDFTLTGPGAGAGGPGDPVPGFPDLILDANITTTGNASFDSGAGIVQRGGTAKAGGNLSLTAANGIVQDDAATNGDANGDAVLEAGSVLLLKASGAGTTTSDGVFTTGISIAGTLMAFPFGQVDLVTLNGDIIEEASGKLVAGTLTGSSHSAPALFWGQSSFDVSSGNTVNILADYSTRNTLGATGSSGLTLEDDVSPDIVGLISIGGSLAIHGPGVNNGTGPGLGQPNTDFTLNASITADGPISFDSDVGIVQLGGKVEAITGNFALIASNGIVQLAGSAPDTSVLIADAGSLLLTAGIGAGTDKRGDIRHHHHHHHRHCVRRHLSAAPGIATLLVGAGDITEAQGARLIANNADWQRDGRR